MKPTKDSQSIYRFLEKLPKKFRIQPTTLPDTNTTKILTQWIEKLAQIIPRESTPETLPNLPQPPQLYWNWIPEQIRTIEIPKLTHYLKTTFQVQHPQQPDHPRTVSVYISSTTPTPQQFLQRIQLAVQLLTHYSPPPCHHSPLHLYIYLTKARKNIPVHPDQILDENHANTAFTTSCNLTATPQTQEPKYIILFREEEVFKVLLHELFHALGLDFSHDSMATQKTATFIREHFGITLPDIRLFETYCETWATILHCLILAFLKTPSQQPITPEKVIQEFFRLFAYEQNFVLFQCAKVLHYHQLSYQQFFTTPRTHQQPKYKKGGTRKKTNPRRKKGGTQKNPSTPQTYRENTQIFCYYILKSAVFQNLPLFIQQFPPPFSVEESIQFAKFVQKCFLQSNFEQNLYSYTTLFQKTGICSNPQPPNTKICNTMRQTATEMAISPETSSSTS